MRRRGSVVGTLAAALLASLVRSACVQGEEPAPPAEPAAEPVAEEDDLAGVAPFSDRNVALRLEGTELADVRAKAIEAGIAWLVAHQTPSGAWKANELQWCNGEEQAEAPEGAAKYAHATGVTGLALCAILSGGYDHTGDSAASKACRRGVEWLVSQQDSEGCIATRDFQHYVYAHGYATRALLEAYTRTGDPALRRPVQAAIDFTYLARNPTKGWRYGIQPGENDLSVTGLMVINLLLAGRTNQLAADAGKREPLRLRPETGDEAAVRQALAYVDGQTDEYGRAGYMSLGSGPARTAEMVDRFPGERSEAMTAVGLAVRALLPEALKQRPTNLRMTKLGTRLLVDLLPEWAPDKGTIDLYYWYYGTLALSRLGGDAWKAWDAALAKALLPSQRIEGTPCQVRGSWDGVDPWSPEAGRIYMTSLCVMSLAATGRTVDPAASTQALGRQLGRGDLSPAERRRLLRTTAVQGLAGLEGALLPSLQSPDPSVRAEAARALSATGPSRRGVVAFLGLLRDPDVGVRRAALESIARMPKEHREALGAAALPALADADASVRLAALGALAALEPKPAGWPDALRARLADADPSAKATAAGLAAALALEGADAALLDALRGPDLVARSLALRFAQGAAVGPALEAALLEIVAGTDADARVMAAALLDPLAAHREKTDPILLDGLDSPRALPQAAALDAFARRSEPTPALVAPLSRLLEVGARPVRVAAARALARSGGGGALSLLYAATEDRDPAVVGAALAAVDALGIAPPAQAETMLRRLAAGAEARETRGILRGMVRLGTGSLEAMRRWLGDAQTTPAARATILEAAAEMGPVARPLESAIIPLLLAELDPKRAATLAAALGAIGARDARAVPALQKWAEGRDDRAGVAATEALLGLLPTVPAAEEALARVASTQARVDVRRAAIRALGKAKAPKPATFDVLFTMLEHSDSGVASDAESALVEIGKPAVARLAARLDTRNVSRQLRVLSVFIRMGPKAKAARSAIAKLAGSDVGPLGERAQEALIAIGG